MPRDLLPPVPVPPRSPRNVFAEAWADPSCRLELTRIATIMAVLGLALLLIHLAGCTPTEPAPAAMPGGGVFTDGDSTQTPRTP